MKSPGSEDEVSELLIVLDAEACVLDTRTPLLNCLGVVANLRADRLQSPWKTTKAIAEVLVDTEVSVGRTLEGPTSIPASCRCRVPNDRCAASTFHIKRNCLEGTEEEHGSAIAQLDCPDHCQRNNLGPTGNSKVDAVNDSSYDRLQRLIQEIREKDIPTREVIEEAVSLADAILHSGYKNAAKYDSFLKCFNEACVVKGVVTDDTLLESPFSEDNKVTVTPFEEFLGFIAVSSYDALKCEEAFRTFSSTINSYLWPFSSEETKRVTVLLVSHLTSAVQKLIDIGGVTLRNSGSWNLHTVDTEGAIQYIGHSKGARLILCPSGSSIAGHLADQLKGCNRDFELLQALDPHHRKEGRFATPSKPEKVDLQLEPDLLLYSDLSTFYIRFNTPIVIQGTVVKGFGRGAATLGIPTANLDCEAIPHLVPGVYIGTCWLHGNTEVESHTELNTILSIGFNPQFDDALYSVEPYIYHSFRSTFFGQRLKLSIEGFLRTEGRFTSVNGLVEAIQQDISRHKLIIRRSRWE